jgi:hypothetical protein
MIALVWRKQTGCRQYPFETIEELERWTNRKPYKNEVITVMPVNSDNSAGERRQMAATDALEFLRTYKEVE